MKKVFTLLALVFLAAAPLVSVAQRFEGLDRDNERLEPQSTVSPAPSQQQTTAEQNSSNSYTFTPLTNLPGISGAATSDTLPSFFNNLYKLCIGAAAVIAILQIMRAGTYFMFNKGSVAHNERGKSLIMNSILGLLLVLSPAIVFGIINPDILNLRLNLEGLRPNPLERVDISSHIDAVQRLAAGITVTVTNPREGAGCTIVAEAQRAQCETFLTECTSSQGRPVFNTGSGVASCPSNATTCSARLLCRFDSTPSGSSPATGPVPDTQAITNQEFEWRLLVTNTSGGRVSSSPNEWNSPGPGRRHPTQQACRTDLNSFMSTFTQRHPGWSTEAVCSCEQPRSAFAACRN